MSGSNIKPTNLIISTFKHTVKNISKIIQILFGKLKK